MTQAGADGEYDYWFVEVKPPYHRLRYGFEIKAKDETIYYGESGFCDTPAKDISDYFCFPFMNQADLFTPPEWVKETIWYQIFPERFANGDHSVTLKIHWLGEVHHRLQPIISAVTFKGLSIILIICRS